MRKEKKQYNIKMIFPFLFWKQCEACEDLLKYEWVWKTEVAVPRYGNLPNYKYIYLCTMCCEFEKDVEKYLVKYINEHRIIKPPHISPPPPKKYNQWGLPYKKG